MNKYDPPGKDPTGYPGPPPPPPPTPAVTLSLCEAIARMEGWGVPNSRSRRNFNPGNICYGNFAKRHGATGSDGRFAIFPSAEVGFKALGELLGAAYSGLTLEEAIKKYAPPNENDTTNYAHLVSQWTGMGLDTVLTPEMCGEGEESA